MWECGLKLIMTRTQLVFKVTPYVGVWIETCDIVGLPAATSSLLMWECGLKRTTFGVEEWQAGHSLCGSVD